MLVFLWEKGFEHERRKVARGIREPALPAAEADSSQNWQKPNEYERALVCEADGKTITNHL